MLLRTTASGLSAPPTVFARTRPRHRRAVRTQLASIQDLRQRDLALAIFDGAEGAPVAATVQRYLQLTPD